MILTVRGAMMGNSEKEVVSCAVKGDSGYFGYDDQVINGTIKEGIYKGIVGINLAGG